MRTIDDLDAVEAALEILCENGITISSPRDGDLDDLEQERFNAVVDACRAYAVRRASPSQVAPQPQAGEAVAGWLIGGETWTRDKAKADDCRARSFMVEPLYASPQPANPAQVTDAMVEIGLRAAEEACMERTFGEFREDSTFETAFTDEFKEQFRLIHRRALTAAIGAGGQAVAAKEMDAALDRFETAAFAKFANLPRGKADREKAIASRAAEYNASRQAILSALSQPQSADERVVEALRIAEERLSSLLARIHRDGGHYEAAHGTKKAWTDADEIIARIYADDTHPVHSPAALSATEGQ